MKKQGKDRLLEIISENEERLSNLRKMINISEYDDDVSVKGSLYNRDETVPIIEKGSRVKIMWGGKDTIKQGTVTNFKPLSRDYRIQLDDKINLGSSRSPIYVDSVLVGQERVREI